MTQLKSSIIKLRLKGLPYSQIAKQLDCSRSVVSYHCSQLKENESIRKINEIRESQRFQEKVTELQLQDIQKLRNLGCAISEIAEATHTTQHTVKIATGRKSITRTPGLSSYDRVKRRRQRLKVLAIVYKGGSCKQCGYSRCPTALEFHHRDSSLKDGSPSSFTSWNKFKLELDKCDLLCANCHREIHYEDRQ